MSTNQRDVKTAYLLSESRAQEWSKSVHENVFSTLVERWEGTVIPEFISATLAACVHFNIHLQYEEKLKSPWCPQQCLLLCVLDNNMWVDIHMCQSNAEEKILRKESLW